MRKQLIFMAVLLLSSRSYSQDINLFFDEVGSQILASLAHPTSTFQRAEIEITDQGILLDIFYVKTKTCLFIKKRGSFFTGIEVLDDTDYIPPFFAVEVIKNHLLKESYEISENERVKTDFERILKKAVYEMDGKEMTCMILSMSWMDY